MGDVSDLSLLVTQAATSEGREWVHLPRWGTYQYSDDFVTWLVNQYDRDNEFFAKARARNYELTH